MANSQRESTHSSHAQSGRNVEFDAPSEQRTGQILRLAETGPGWGGIAIAKWIAASDAGRPKQGRSPKACAISYVPKAVLPIQTPTETARIVWLQALSKPRNADVSRKDAGQNIDCFQP